MPEQNQFNPHDATARLYTLRESIKTLEKEETAVKEKLKAYLAENAPVDEKGHRKWESAQGLVLVLERRSGVKLTDQAVSLLDEANLLGTVGKEYLSGKLLFEVLGDSEEPAVEQVFAEYHSLRLLLQKIDVWSSVRQVELSPKDVEQAIEDGTIPQERVGEFVEETEPTFALKTPTKPKAA